MTLSLLIMLALAALSSLAGWPMLVAPAAFRAALGLRDTPQMAYVLRIVGAMLSALGIILAVFALSYWTFAG